MNMIDAVDVIIPHYNNVDGIRSSIDVIVKHVDLCCVNLFISDAGSNDQTWQDLNLIKGVTLLDKQNKQIDYFDACNNGVMNSRCRFFVILNPVIIDTEFSLSDAVDKMKTIPRMAACKVSQNAIIFARSAVIEDGLFSASLHAKLKKHYMLDEAIDWSTFNFSNKKRTRKLNLGCGNQRVSGYIGSDIFMCNGVDEIYSMDKIPYKDSTIDGIYSEHALEHLEFLKVECALKEWYRVLKNDCELILKIPDFELCCQCYLNPPEQALKEVDFNVDLAKQWFKYTIFGIQESLAGEPNEAQTHRSGYSKSEIKKTIENAGFKIITISNYNGYDTPSIEVHAVK